MDCPRDGAPLTTMRVGVTSLARCPTCRGVAGSRVALESLVQAPIVSRASQLSIAGLGEGHALRCPACAGALEPEESRDAPGDEILACLSCGEVWLDETTLERLRTVGGERRAREQSLQGPARIEGRPITRAIAQSERPMAPSADGTPASPTPSPPTEALVERPVFSPGPLPELAVLMGSLTLAWLFAWTRLGEAVSFLVRMQFHEFGHASVAWSTGRSALPMPFGWTSWSLERSWLFLSMAFLFATLLTVWGLREKKAIAVVVAAVMFGVLAFGLVTPLAVSEPWLVAGGPIGEAMWPAVALLAFHLPMPERMRWDFFRWVLALFACVALASVVQDDLAIGRGARPLPLGSFITGREGDGDLERLMNDYGWSEQGLRTMFGSVGLAALVLGVLPHPLILGARWLRDRARQRR